MPRPADIVVDGEGHDTRVTGKTRLLSVTRVTGPCSCGKWLAGIASRRLWAIHVELGSVVWGLVPLVA